MDKISFVITLIGSLSLLLVNIAVLECRLQPYCDFDTQLLVTKGVALNGHAFMTNKAADEMECAKQCMKMKRCKSLNFDTEIRRCELNDAPLTESTSSRNGDNLLYSDISHWPSQIEPECYARPCGDDEVCIPGQLAGGTSCSYTCFKKVARCPIPYGATDFTQSRTIGSIFEHTCGRGFVGGDAGLCLQSGEWNKTIDTTCAPIHGSSCTSDGECESINGSCIDNTCQCASLFKYDADAAFCITKIHGSSCTSDGECESINGSCIDNTCQCASLFKYDADAAFCITKCELDWIPFETKCYLFEIQELQYLDARKLCVSKGSVLVQVDSVAENDFLRNKMVEIKPDPISGYWNDLFEVTVNGQERWRTSNDSLNADVAIWSGTNPNDHGGQESCTVFRRLARYKLVDYYCVNDVREDSDNSNSYFPRNRPLCEKDQ